MAKNVANTQQAPILLDMFWITITGPFLRDFYYPIIGDYPLKNLGLYSKPSKSSLCQGPKFIFESGPQPVLLGAEVRNILYYF